MIGFGAVFSQWRRAEDHAAAETLAKIKQILETQAREKAQLLAEGRLRDTVDTVERYLQVLKLRNEGKLAEAQQMLNASILKANAVVKESPQSEFAYLALGKAYQFQGSIYQDQKRFDDARVAMNGACQAYREAKELAPTDLEVLRKLAAMHVSRGYLYQVRLGKLQQAVEDYEVAEKLLAPAAAEFPQNWDVQADLSSCCNDLCTLTRLAKEKERSFEYAKKAVACLDTAPTDWAQHSRQARYLYNCLQQRARGLLERDRVPEALADFERAIALMPAKQVIPQVYLEVAAVRARGPASASS